MGTALGVRSASRFRRLFALVLALAMALGGLAGVAPAAAQAGPEPITQREFDRLTEAAQRNSILFGPEDGEISLEEEFGDGDPAGIEVESFYARAEFVNPSDGVEVPWDYGFTFRSQGRNDFLALLVLSNGAWGVVGPADVGDEGLIASDIVETVNDGEGVANVVDLYADGEVGHFGLNGDYVATFDLPIDGAGDIIITSGSLNEEGPGGETAYTDFLVWGLDEGGSDPDDELSDDDLTATAEAEEEEDLSDDDLTATAEAEDEELSDDDLTATAEAEEEDELSDDDLTATAEAEDERGGDEPTYTSPAFGYSLSYEDPWELEDELSDDDGDLLVITTRASRLQIVGNETRDTPEECVDALIEDVEDDRDVVDSEVAQDQRDRDLRDDSDELSWVVLFLTLEDEDGEETDFTGYYECRVIEEGDSLLTVVHLAPSDDYNDEIENRTAVLDTIELDGGSGRDDEPSDDDLTATAEAEEEESDDRTATAEAEEDEDTPEAETPESEDVTPEATAEIVEGTLFVFMEATDGSELAPFGSVEPSGRGESQVFLFAIGAGGSTVSIHEGSCANIGASVVEVGQIDETGLLNVSVDVDIDDITGDFVMILSTDGTADTALACGVLEPVEAE